MTHYNPRKWVLEHMSDEVCARNLCALANLQLGYGIVDKSHAHPISA